MKRTIRTLRTALGAAALGTLAVAVSGCSALNVGEEEFSCTGMPGSVYCHSARDVYEKTNDGVVPSPVGKTEGAYNPDCRDCIRAEDVNPDLKVEEDGDSRWAVTKDGRRLKVVGAGDVASARARDPERPDDEVVNNYVSPALPDHPVPIRTPAQVMRIWIAPYVDVSGDLIAPGFVYTEVEPRRWIYPDDEKTGSTRTFNPLKAASGSGSGLRGANAWKTPSSYSNPVRGASEDDREYTNSLLKFRREREQRLKTMSN